MAAATATMRIFLRDVIGIPDAVGNVHARRDAIRNEGLYSMDDLAEFDEQDVKILCSSMRKPGGMIPDPADPNRMIPNPGYNVPAIAEKRLRLAAYGARIYKMVGRNVNPEALSRLRLREFENHKRAIEEHEDPEPMPQVSKVNGIMKALDLIPIHLRERIGTRKVSLSYVIRENANPPNLQPLVADRITSNDYDTLMDELIAVTPHNGAEYTEDNAKVNQILQEVVNGTSHESLIKQHRRGRDGRSAYLALVQHNMGSSKWDRIIETCENYLLRNEWNGKNVRFTLKMHISKHRDAHNELVRASQFVAYEVPNDHTRVGRLLKSITSKDGAILAAITHIQGTTAMRESFEEAADFLLLTAPAAKEIERSYRISAVVTGNGGESQKSTAQKSGYGASGVEFRYHTRKEYDRLNQKQKRELHEWRKSANAKSGNNNAGNTNRIASLETQLKELIEENNNMKVRISALSSNNHNKDDRHPLTNPLNQRNS